MNVIKYILIFVYLNQYYLSSVYVGKVWQGARGSVLKYSSISVKDLPSVSGSLKYK